jgi:formiminotetrahydrofolate cyclodeaminase
VETFEQYLRNLASEAPVPGGGSAAAIVGATGAALVGMVARICAGSPKYAAHAVLAHDLIASSDRQVEAFARARERDERAFGNVVAAQRLPKETTEHRDERRRALDLALLDAASEPLAAAELCLGVLRDAVRLLEIPNESLRSDVGCAAEFGFAALQACAYNVRVNHRYARDAAAIAKQAETLADRERQARDALARVRQAVTQTLGGDSGG